MTPRQSCVSSQLPADREDRENSSQARALWCAERVGRQSLLGLGEAEASGSGECPALRWGCPCLASSYFEPYSESSGTKEDWGSGGGGTIHGSHSSDRMGFFYIIITNVVWGWSLAVVESTSTLWGSSLACCGPSLCSA